MYFHFIAINMQLSDIQFALQYLFYKYAEVYFVS